MDHTEALQIIGKRIRELRIEKGLTVTELAGDLKITKGGMSKIENGKTNFSMRILFEVTSALTTTPEKLFEGIKPAPLEIPNSTVI